MSNLDSQILFYLSIFFAGTGILIDGVFLTTGLILWMMALGTCMMLLPFILPFTKIHDKLFPIDEKPKLEQMKQ